MITAHCLVKNEENFIWYAINSVIDYVDEILIWDQGSADKTREIINSINDPKIKFREMLGDVAKVREMMLKGTKEGWVLILDGDEIWYEDGIASLIGQISKVGPAKDCAVIPNYMLIGDIYHYQESAAGRYKIVDKMGHYNIRAIRKTLGLHVEGVYPNEALVDKNGVKIQDLYKERILFLDKPYLHASFLKRSSKDRKKVKYEIGESFPKDFYYPEVFFKPRPDFVPSPWKSMNTGYKLRAILETPLKRIKRRII